MREYYIIFFLLLAVNIYGQGIGYNEEFQVNTYIDSDQYYPKINTLSNGNYVICWRSRAHDNSSYGIYVQLFDSEGEKIGEETHVNTHTDSGQRYPSISDLLNNNFIII